MKEQSPILIVLFLFLRKGREDMKKIRSYTSILKYLGIPIVLTVFMCQKTFDGKKPYGFLKSIITYALRPKVTYAGKQIRLKKETMNESITIVRSEQLDGISD